MTNLRSSRPFGFSEVNRRTLVRKLWAGYGIGHRCDYCGRPITATDVEFEVELASAVYRFHPPCQSAWEAESPLGSATAR
jgi:hypothetical protein